GFPQGSAFAGYGLLAGAFPFGALYLLKGIGGGDVKLFAALGAWLGAKVTIFLAGYSILLAGFFALCLMMLRIPALRPAALKLPWPWDEHPALAGRRARFPFMLAVAPAFVLLLAIGNGEVGSIGLHSF